MTDGTTVCLTTAILMQKMFSVKISLHWEFSTLRKLQKAQQIADYYKKMSLQVLHIYVVSPVANIEWFFISNTIWVIDSIFSWHTHQDVLWQLKVKSNTQVIAENSYFFLSFSQPHNPMCSANPITVTPIWKW